MIANMKSCLWSNCQVRAKFLLIALKKVFRDNLTRVLCEHPKRDFTEVLSAQWIFLSQNFVIRNKDSRVKWETFIIKHATLLSEGRCSGK